MRTHAKEATHKVVNEEGKEIYTGTEKLCKAFMSGTDTIQPIEGKEAKPKKAAKVKTVKSKK